MKTNPNTFKAIPNYLYEYKVYSAKEIEGKFYEGTYILAHREEVLLTQDSVYKTQFINPVLARALLPKTSNTTIRIYDADRKEINNIYNFFELDREHQSIVFNVEPSIKPAYCSVVIYDAEDITQVPLTNGRNTMDPDYNITEDKHIVTKDYLDTRVNSLKAGLNALDKFTILQGGKPLPEAIRYTDNQVFPVIFCSAISKNIKVIVEPFIIDSKYDEDTVELQLRLNGEIITHDKVKDILKGDGTTNWIYTSTKNIFDEGSLGSVYWLNGYSVELPAEENFLKYIPIIERDPTVTMEVVVVDKTGKTYSTSQRVGLDTEVSKCKDEHIFEPLESVLFSYKTVWVSGNRYLPDNDTMYSLPIHYTMTNSFLRYYRPEVVARIGTIRNGQDWVQDVKVLQSHLPNTTQVNYEDYWNVKIDKYTTGAFLELLNINGEVVCRTECEIDCATSVDTETYRVETPSALDVFTEEDLPDWVPSNPVKEWDMILKKGVYNSKNENSALCFKIPSDGKHYSHIKIDVEHDGEMYIRSEGNTGWLSCQEYAKPFDKPDMNGEGCKLGEGNLYTFGKSVYNTPVYVRILNATEAKVKGFELN